MKFVTFFIVLFATTSPLLGMTDVDELTEEVVRFHVGEDQPKNPDAGDTKSASSSDTAGIALPATIPELVQDLLEHGACYFDANSERYQFERDQDILLLLIRYTKPKDENGENLVDYLKIIFDYVRSVPGLEKIITPVLTADIIKHCKISVNEIYQLSLMHDAAYVGDANIVRTLCLAGADVNCQNNDGKWSPLLMAANRGHADACRVLLEHKAAINAKTRPGNTALHYAAKAGDHAVCQVLLQAKADVNIKNNDGKRAVTLVPKDRRDIIQLFLTGGEK